MSASLYALLVALLLGVVYVVVLPWFAFGWRFVRRRKSGWHLRRDPGLTTVERLRSPF